LRSLSGDAHPTEGGEARMTAATLGAPPARQRAVNVLVVDDSADQRDLISTHLRRAGCSVALAATGEQALLKVAHQTFDLVFMDLLLPGIDGWELADRLRAHNPALPIVVTSVLDTQDYPDSDAKLPKPLSGAQMRAVLRQLVPGWQPR
jgi:CheY-like chemotaxis protein